MLKTITAFTLAHSIALSIVFLAAEVIRQRRGEDVVTAKYPWVVAFGFGLFHGLGFAGALSEIGVPANEVPLALLMFNVGVEIGQVMFVVAVAGVLALVRRIRVPERLAWPGSRRLAPYAIGCIAAFWVIERVISSMSLAG